IRHTLSSPYCEFHSSHQLGVNAPRSPPKSPGLVHVPTSVPLIHSVISDGQSSSCSGASEQTSKLTCRLSRIALVGRRFGKRYSTKPHLNQSSCAFSRSGS